MFCGSIDFHVYFCVLSRNITILSSSSSMMSEMNNKIRLHRGDQVIMGANSASNKRITEIYLLSQLKMIDCIMELYVFAEEMRFSLIFCSCPHLHGLSL